ncbi:MAG: NAD synthetase [Cyanobacteria bacterium P01_D01_bin.105]
METPTGSLDLILGVVAIAILLGGLFLLFDGINGSND